MLSKYSFAEKAFKLTRIYSKKTSFNNKTLNIPTMGSCSKCEGPRRLSSSYFSTTKQTSKHTFNENSNFFEVLGVSPNANE